jgi:hypothetical protein
LNQCRAAGQLKYRAVVIGAIKPDIPACPFDAVGIATEIDRFKPAYVYRAHRPRKEIGLDTFRAVSPTE